MIGIPRGLFYYLYGDLWKQFFDELGIKYIVSPESNKEILDYGCKYSNDEMCLSLKNYIGHVYYLKDKCDYILVPYISNYGLNDQMCTNFTSIYDIISNLFDTKILSYEIDYLNKKTEEKAFTNLGKKLGKSKIESKKAYNKAIYLKERLDNININHNLLKLKNNKIKILLISHPYNSHDNYIGRPIIDLLEKQNVEVIDANLFNKEEANKNAYKYSSMIYFKYSKELIGSIDMGKFDGILFLTTFPCGLDSLVNELVMRKIDIPYINIVIDDISSLSGFETRIESFIDLINERKKHEISVSNDG